MQLINNLKIKNKLILILIVPVFSLALYSIMLFEDSRKEFANAVEMAHLTELAIAVNYMVDHVQNELDTSTQYLKSRGKTHGFALKNMRRKTQTGVEELNKTIEMKGSDSLSEDFKQRMLKMVNGLDQLQDKRKEIDALKLKKRDTQAFYNELIESMLSLIELMPRMSFDKNLANISSAYINFLRMKNYVGKERHILFDVFSRDQFIGKEFNNFTRAVNYQQVYQSAFLSLAKEEVRALFEQKIQGESFKKSAEISDKAFQSADYGAFNISPQEWMIVQSNKIKLLNDVAEMLTQDIKSSMIEAQASAKNLQMLLAISVLLCLFLTIAFWWLISREIGKSVNSISHVMDRIAIGDLSSDTTQAGKDEFGHVLNSLGKMQADLKKRIDHEATIAASNARVKEALDNVSASVMVADENNDIIYVNGAAIDLFKRIETDLGKEINGFKADAILGSNIDTFHKNPSHQQHLLASMSTRHTASFMAGGHSMSFIANPVKDEQGKRLGTVVEWKDRTDEVNTEMEIQSIVDAFQQGDLNRRISTQEKQGFFLTLSQGINEMVSEVSSSLDDINNVMSALSHGDLTKTITNNYQGTFGDVATNVNDTIQQIGQIVGEIRNSADEVNSTSSEILDGNNSLSARTEHQAAALEQTASSMEQITSTVKQNSENAQQANTLSASAGDLADKGGQVVDSAIEAMQEINSSSEKIAEIIGVIDEIAFQTNLLALNASVEAARAGEQGRGFAVVATEVRNLAQRSATAAKEIKDLIQDSVQKVDAGSELVNRSGDTLKEIVLGVKKVGDIVGEIAAASQEQTTGIEQVNAAVTSMDETTQQNAALAEQTSAASVSLSERSNDMSARLGFFSLGDDWVSSASYPSKVIQSPLSTAPTVKNTDLKPVVSQFEDVSKSENTPIQEQNFDDDDWEEF